MRHNKFYGQFVFADGSVRAFADRAAGHLRQRRRRSQRLHRDAIPRHRGRGVRRVADQQGTELLSRAAQSACPERLGRSTRLPATHTVWRCTPRRHLPSETDTPRTRSRALLGRARRRALPSHRGGVVRSRPGGGRRVPRAAATARGRHPRRPFRLRHAAGADAPPLAQRLGGFPRGQ